MMARLAFLLAVVAALLCPERGARAIDAPWTQWMDLNTCSMARRDCQLLYTAGLSTRMHTYPATHRLHPDMLRDVNRWIMEMCNET